MNELQYYGDVSYFLMLYKIESRMSPVSISECHHRRNDCGEYVRVRERRLRGGVSGEGCGWAAREPCRTFPSYTPAVLPGLMNTSSNRHLCSRLHMKLD